MNMAPLRSTMHADQPPFPVRQQELPSAQTTPPNVLLSWADKLPFAPGTIDYIVS